MMTTVKSRKLKRARTVRRSVTKREKESITKREQTKNMVKSIMKAGMKRIRFPLQR